MSTTTPPTTGTERDTTTDGQDRPRPGTTGTGRPDRWAAPADEAGSASSSAPRTFDPFCTRRLRSCVDAENAAFPNADRDGRP